MSLKAMTPKKPDESSEETNEESGGTVLVLLWIGAAALSVFGTKFALGQVLGIQTIWKARLGISSAATFESPRPTTTIL